MIPGPFESDQDFLERDKALEKVPFPPEFSPALNRVIALFDIAPTELPIIYSNKGLAPWHGGVMDPKMGLQLREAFRKKKRYLGLYSRDEIVAHELVHAGRSAFNEPKFEELFAYRVSHNPLRRWLGPLVERPIEVWVFLISILIPLFADYTCLILGFFEGLRLLIPLKIFPGLLLGFALFRNGKRHRILKGLLKKLGKISTHPRAIAYRLSDDEIISFSKMESKAICDHLKKGQGIRFKQIQRYL